MSTRGATGQGCPHLWGAPCPGDTGCSEDYLYQGSLQGRNSIFVFAHKNGFWRHNLGWVCFALITWLPPPKVGTGTRVLRELERQMSSYFCEDVKGYLRRDMTFSLGRMKKKFNFLPLTFMNHSFPFVCGDRFLYFSQREIQFSLSKGKQKRAWVKILWLFQFFQGPLSKEGTWWIHPYSCPSQVLLYLQLYLQDGMDSSGHQEGKANINTFLFTTSLFDITSKTWFSNSKKAFPSNGGILGSSRVRFFHETKGIENQRVRNAPNAGGMHRMSC